ncbi:hypothetical protein JW897_22230 [Chromobacterium alkanivorans]|uniref:hypothetical protein n=1 Tax=Chromobacterium alkanivorans TaxID=1071719 RepID=UPI00196746FA|nr:hypothetical protein [Chromobacterium alkanivorans]MBN3006463.1 hypothetical protein [Chromobacterium alkanivorans]
MSMPPVLKGRNDKGEVEYHLEFDPAWDGFDSFVEYLQIYWEAEVSESNDDIYMRRWVLRSHGVPITVRHDGQIGNYFLREDGVFDQGLLEKIEQDLLRRMG